MSAAKPTVVFCAALPIACVDMFAQLSQQFDAWVVVHSWRTWGLVVERTGRPERVVMLCHLPGAPRGPYMASPAEAWRDPFRLFFARIGASRLVVFNHYRPPYRAGAVQAARELGIAPIFVERGPLASRYYFDPVGVGPEGALGLPEVWEAVQSRALSSEAQAAALEHWRKCQRASVEPQPARETREALRASLGVAPDQRLAFFPMQVDDDIQITRFSPWIRDMARGLAVVSEAARAEGWRLLVKPHPRSHLANLSREAAHVTISPRVHIGAALEAADAVVTVNSGAGLEALTLARTVITLGRGIYTDKGLTLEAGDAAELRRILARAADWRPPMGLVARLVAFLSQDYLLPYPLGGALSRAASIVAEPKQAVPRMLGQRPWPAAVANPASPPSVAGRRTALLLVAAREETTARARDELLRLAPDLRISVVELPRAWWRAAQRTAGERAALVAGIVHGRACWRRHDVAIAVVDDTLLRPRAVRCALMACRAAQHFWWCPGQAPLAITWASFRARELGDWFATRRRPIREPS